MVSFAACAPKCAGMNACATEQAPTAAEQAPAATEQAPVTAKEPVKNAASKAKPLRQNHCFAPGCKSGQNLRRPKGPDDPRVSLFRVPRDEQMFRRWQRYMPPRPDGKKLMHNSAVCERHFDPQFVVRYYEHIVNKQLVRIERGVPALTPDAVPTVFPESPKYYTRRVPRRRKPPQRAPLPPPKPRRVRRAPSSEGEGASPPDPTPAEDVSAVADECPEPVTTERAAPPDPVVSAEPEEQIVEREVTPAFPYEDMPLPSRLWARHVVSERPLVLAYSTCRLSDDDPGRLVTEKLVLVREYAEHAECHVYFEGRRLHCFDGPGGTDYPSTLLQRVDRVRPCPGLGDEEEFPFAARVPYVEGRGSRLHSAQCTSAATARGTMCDKCVHGRKLLRKRLARMERRRALEEGVELEPPSVDSSECVIVEDVSEEMCISENSFIPEDAMSVVEVGLEVAESVSVESGSGDSGPSSAAEQPEVNGTAVPCEAVDLKAISMPVL